MAHHEYYITQEKKLNREERCRKCGRIHDKNREKAKERKRSKIQSILAGHSRYEPKKEF